LLSLLWQAGKQVTGAAAWLVWLIASVFAFTGSIGFSSINVADVTLARASRATPAVTTARAALDDAMTARNRECAGGVGRFCHERERAVTDRHRALDAALSSVEQASAPQTDAAIKIVAWISAGKLKPTAEDFNMLRLVLLALLPQLGGVLLMPACPNWLPIEMTPSCASHATFLCVAQAPKSLGFLGKFDS
jgi:hypothetical protein